MGKRCLTISLPEELVDKLLAEAEEAEIPFEEYIEQILAAKEISQTDKTPNQADTTPEKEPEASLAPDNDAKIKAPASTFPSVALVKEEEEKQTIIKTAPSLFKPEPSLNSEQPKIRISVPSQIQLPPKAPNPRRLQLEAEMKEVSLLIETAIESEKKQQYVMKYAMLAAELDALL
jgi:hypothetical protein